MAIETVELEGDFVIKNSRGNESFRFQAHDDSFEIYALQAHIVMTDVEAMELMGWLRRRFEEPFVNGK